MSTYNRDTELRNVQPNDLYRLAVILDENGYWRKLMEIIPKELNNQQFGNTSDIDGIFSKLATSERKYERDHLRLLEDAFKRSGESRLCSQILFDEWGSSGRKYERPTLGVLLHLLLYTQLFRAADFVAETLLKEAKPSRPVDGPGAEITCDLPSSIFEHIHKMANESENYPDTELLQRDANCVSSLMNNNKDFYTKYRKPFEKHFAPSDWMAQQSEGPPIPPPRTYKSARLQSRQQQSQLVFSQISSDQIQANINKADSSNTNIIEHEAQQQPTHVEALTATITNNIPKISLLMNATSSSMGEASIGSSIAFVDSLPKLSFLRGNSNRYIETFEEVYGTNSIPNIIYSNNIIPEHISNSYNTDSHVNLDLPAISALNLNGERDINASGSNSSTDNVPAEAFNYCSLHNKNTNVIIDFNVPSVVTSIIKNENTTQANACAIERNVNETKNVTHENIDQFHASVEDNEVVSEKQEEVDDDVDDDNDNDDVPNLSIFNDSSLTSVTNTSGDNSFDHIVNDSRPASADSVPNVF